jgi:hypothetical protein
VSSVVEDLHPVTHDRDIVRFTGNLIVIMNIELGGRDRYSVDSTRHLT